MAKAATKRRAKKRDPQLSPPPRSPEDKPYQATFVFRAESDEQAQAQVVTIGQAIRANDIDVLQASISWDEELRGDAA